MSRPVFLAVVFVSFALAGLAFALTLAVPTETFTDFLEARNVPLQLVRLLCLALFGLASGILLGAAAFLFLLTLKQPERKD